MRLIRDVTASNMEVKGETTVAGMAQHRRSGIAQAQRGVVSKNNGLRQ